MNQNSPPSMQLFALPGLPEICAGDDVGSLIAQAMKACGECLLSGDIVVVAQKIVSKAEGRTRVLSDITPTPGALDIAARSGKDARKVQAILDESSDIMRVAAFPPDGLVIARHRDGWVCANAAIDESNVGADGVLLLLPENPDASAARIAQVLAAALLGDAERPVGVVITDTFGRAWRRGQVNIAIGAAHVPAVVSLVGRRDAFGRVLQVSEPAFADEVAAAAGLLMGKDSATPVIIVRGLEWEMDAQASAKQLVRPVKEDLFL